MELISYFLFLNKGKKTTFRDFAKWYKSLSAMELSVSKYNNNNKIT